MSEAALSTPGYLDRLNPEQRAAVLHGDGPLLVLAGAGSGKTMTLAHRVAHLIVEGADPRRILLMTFSRRAAAEMRGRVGRIAREVMGEKAEALAEGLTWAGTFHAIGARLLREQATEIGLDPDFTIHDREDSADLMNLCRHELGFSRMAKRFPAKGTCLAIYSRAVNARAPLAAALGDFPWCAEWEAELKALFAAYVAAKQAQGVLDYDDLLLYWAELAAEPELGLGARFDHVLIDEYQDTNRVQAAILAGLRPDGRGVTVVGDDAQSIYSFRAAEVRNILDFPAVFSPPARIVTLTRNYRSTAPILAAANAVIAEAREGYAKELVAERQGGLPPLMIRVPDEAAQAAYVCERVLEAREAGVALKGQAALFRTASHSAPLEVELTRRNIPFVKFGGLKFLDTAHVKDVMALLRLAENPRDRVSGFRALRLVPGIGPASAERLLALLAAPGGTEALRGARVPARAAAEWADFVALFAGLRAGHGWPADLSALRAWYEPRLELIHEDAPARIADLATLEGIAAGYPSRARFLTELTLDPPAAGGDLAGPPLLDDDYMILSTIHSAKGQEWKQVFVLNCVDGCIPSDLATGSRAGVEEERRLFYVAMTRAKDALHLLVPARFHVHNQAARGDRHVHAARSRFLSDAVVARLAERSWPPPPPEEARAAPGPRRDLAARMRGMWE
ncbi:ATP-dependent helicase [Amaricoccus solimangrovi]|uniref:DNA 3'-5' helicase n=1 Tax=Amaricoccus solimangrovi TaxID=2589815 RepID=A0A501WZ47_9RHOB|nr:ATP-dependent helicase [Amaricoccus solimangrovi]TPE53585.1 ATP-dependent helicase [Amaricoccus solimangrovi]